MNSVDVSAQNAAIDTPQLLLEHRLKDLRLVGVEITLEALAMAVERQRPNPGLMHHSDRDIQYTAEAYRQTMAKANITPAMSREGNCWDAPWRASSTRSKPAVCPRQ